MFRTMHSNRVVARVQWWVCIAVSFVALLTALAAASSALAGDTVEVTDSVAGTTTSYPVIALRVSGGGLPEPTAPLLTQDVRSVEVAGEGDLAGAARRDQASRVLQALPLVVACLLVVVLLRRWRAATLWRRGLDVWFGVLAAALALAGVLAPRLHASAQWSFIEQLDLPTRATETVLEPGAVAPLVYLEPSPAPDLLMLAAAVVVGAGAVAVRTASTLRRDVDGLV